MTPMVHESNQIISMANAPSFWRFTPVEYKDAFLKDWPNKPFDILEVWKQVDPNGFRTITGAGLFLGPITETAGLDFDGPGTRRNFEHHFGRPPTDLTKTICSTSGRPKRMQMFYKVPKEYWRFIKYKKLKLEGCSEIELRWGHGIQSVICGKHPNKYGDGQGFYSWVDGHGPQDVEIATLPDWFCEKWVELCRPKKSRNFKVKESNEQLQKDSERIKPFLEKYYQPPNNYSDYWGWLDVGMVLHEVGSKLGDENLHLDDWLAWSYEMDNFDEKQCYDKWSSFGKPNGEPLGFGSFYDRAKKDNPDTFDEPVNIAQEDEKTSAKKIKEVMDKLYGLIKNGGSWEDQQAQRSRLYAYKINREEIERKLLFMVAEEHQLTIGEKSGGARRHRSLMGEISQQEILEPLLPGFLLKGRDALLVGESGAGKTLAALAISYAIATGHPNLYDREEFVSTEDRGGTIWIGSDGNIGAYGMVQKYARMLKVPDVNTWDESFTFVGADIEKKINPWAFTVQGLNELINRLEAGHPNGTKYKLVVIDSLKKVMDLGDINFGVGPMGTVMQLMQSIAAKYDVAVLWIHHTKPGAKDGISVSGGNSNIYQIPYCVHCLFKKEVQGLGQVTRWIVEKYRGECSREFEAVLNKEQGLFDLVTDQESTDRTGAILYEVWIRKDCGATTTEVADGIQVDKKKLSYKLTQMVKEDLIFSMKKGWYLTKKGAKRLTLDFPELQENIEEWLKISKLPRAIKIK